jgi:hypothetical protein
LEEPKIVSLTRETLHSRHRLTHRQINDWLGKCIEPADQQEVLTSLAQVAEFIKITDILRKAEIPFVSFKGPLLSQKIYGDPTYRHSKDFDFLIGRESIPKALEELQKNGFQIENNDLPLDQCKLHLWLEHNNQVELYNPESGISVEIHSRLFKLSILPHSELLELIRENSTIVHFNGKEFVAFSHEFELAYLILHGGIHYWNRLKWLVDVKELINKYTLDETKFLAIINYLRAEHLVALCNSLLAIYFPHTKYLPCKCNPPQKLLRYSLNAIEAEDVVEATNFKKYINYFVRRAKLFPQISYKLSVIKIILFAPDLAAKKWMPCSASLNYLLGPFWKLFRGIRLVN